MLSELWRHSHFERKVGPIRLDGILQMDIEETLVPKDVRVGGQLRTMDVRESLGLAREGLIGR